MSLSSARRWFWSLAIGHVVFWTFFPWWMQPSSASYDAMEALAYAPEWVLGTAKHPTLPFWFLEIVHATTARATWGIYLASQLCVLLGLWSVWRLSREFLPESLALLAVFAAMTYRYFNLGSLNYTTSVPPVSLWCAAIYFFVVSVKLNRSRDWIFLGLALGGGALSKYSIFLLIATMLSAIVVYTDLRRLGKTPGPYIAMLVAFLLFLPHAIWVVQHDYITIASGQHSLTNLSHWSNHIVSPLEFLSSQVALFLPILICLVPLTGYAWQYRWRPRAADADDVASFQNRSLLTFLIFVPVMLHAFAAAVGGGHLRPAYGSPLWTLTSLWVLTHLQTTLTPKRMRQSFVVTASVLVATVVCYVANYQMAYTFNPNEGCRIHFPGPALAASLKSAWQKRCGDVLCKWITGNWKIACHAAYRMNDRPRVLCYYDGLEPAQTTVLLNMSDADLNRDGGIVVWDATNFSDGAIPDWLWVRYPRAKVAPEPLSLVWQTTATPPPLRVGYAIVPPPSSPP